jgi:hypothetical protein
MPSFPESRLKKILDILEPANLVPTLFPYLSYIRKIVVMVYNIPNPEEAEQFISRVRRVLLQRCTSARRLTLAYRGPASWALDIPSSDGNHITGNILSGMTLLDQLGLFWMTRIGVSHLEAIAKNCCKLRLLHLQPDRSIRISGLVFSEGTRCNPSISHVMQALETLSIQENDTSDHSRLTTAIELGHHPSFGVDRAMAAILLSNSSGQLREVNLWHLPLEGNYFSNLSLETLRLLTIGNTLIPEQALLELDTNLYSLVSITIDHPRDRPRRSPYGVSKLIRRAPNVKAIHLKHIVFSSILGASIAKCINLTTLVIAPYDYRLPQGFLIDSLELPLRLANHLKGLFSPEELIELDYNIDTLEKNSQVILQNERSSSATNLVNIAKGSAGQNSLTTLELWGNVTGPMLIAAAGIPNLKELRIKNGFCLRNSDIRMFVQRLADGCIATPWKSTSCNPSMTLSPSETRGRHATGSESATLPQRASSITIGTEFQCPSTHTPSSLRSLSINYAAMLTDTALLQLVYSVPSLRYLTLTDSRATIEALWFMVARGLGSLRRLHLTGMHLRRSEFVRIGAQYPEAARRIELSDANQSHFEDDYI